MKRSLRSTRAESSRVSKSPSWKRKKGKEKDEGHDEGLDGPREVGLEEFDAKTEKKYKKMVVFDLRANCRRKGLDEDGRKADLVARLLREDRRLFLKERKKAVSASRASSTPDPTSEAPQAKRVEVEGREPTPNCKHHRRYIKASSAELNRVLYNPSLWNCASMTSFQPR